MVKKCDYIILYSLICLNLFKYMIIYKWLMLFYEYINETILSKECIHSYFIFIYTLFITINILCTSFGEV